MTFPRACDSSPLGPTPRCAYNGLITDTGPPCPRFPSTLSTASGRLPDHGRGPRGRRRARPRPGGPDRPALALYGSGGPASRRAATRSATIGGSRMSCPRSPRKPNATGSAATSPSRSGGNWWNARLPTSSASGTPHARNRATRSGRQRPPGFPGNSAPRRAGGHPSRVPTRFPPARRLRPGPKAPTPAGRALERMRGSRPGRRILRRLHQAETTLRLLAHQCEQFRRQRLIPARIALQMRLIEQGGVAWVGPSHHAIWVAGNLNIALRSSRPAAFVQLGE